ncbi:hypothetical protein ELOC111193_05765 [Elizabethkingia occulta]|uniref:Lipocalin-like domain-containing protein n=1 Tax=Elizabethkingia occulta TaxID=1867263 RepID=A0A1T3MSH2_9FLAO|nr:hypothetical protein [Elizabethkingia occulta]OPC67555.1 hypothetical protein BAZ10_16020 [Elizabethkingia occulta]
MNTAFLNINTKFTKLFLLLALIILSLSSCENRDTPASFNPPEWIKGEWSGNNGIKYQFFEHDFILTTGGSRFSYGFINGNKSMINVIKSTSSEYIFEIVNYDITNTFSRPGSLNNTNNLWQRTSSRKLYFKFKRNSNNSIIENNNTFFRTSL